MHIDLKTTFSLKPNHHVKVVFINGGCLHGQSPECGEDKVRTYLSSLQINTSLSFDDYFSQWAASDVCDHCLWNSGAMKKYKNGDYEESFDHNFFLLQCFGHAMETFQSVFDCFKSRNGKNFLFQDVWKYILGTTDLCFKHDSLLNHDIFGHPKRFVSLQSTLASILIT